MVDLSRLDAFQLANIEMLVMIPYNESGNCMQEKAGIISQGPLCMTALEPADVLVAALQAGAHSIKLMHLWPGWWMKIAEEDIACKTESLCNFFLEVARFGKLLGINIFDYEVCIDVPDKEIPFFSLRKALLGEPAMRYCSKS